MDLGFRELATGLGATEGPVITQGGEVLVTSMDHGRLYRVDGDQPIIYATTGGGPNGAAEGPDHRIYVAQNGGQWRNWHPGYMAGMTGGIQVVGPGRSIEWLTLDPISPNDLCFGPDGYLYITDSTRRRTDDGRIWRCDIENGRADLLLSVSWFPNGIAFGREDDALYVASTFEQRIYRFPLSRARLGRPETVVQLLKGRPDGFAFDIDGNFLVAALPGEDGVSELQVWTPHGRLIETVIGGDGQRLSNVALSPAGQLIVTDAGSQAALIVEGWPTAGLPLHPFR
jgi:gluconolactonase